MHADSSKAIDQKYRHLFEEAGEAVMVFVEGMAVFHNPAARVLFGMSPDEPSGLPLGSFIHPEDRVKVIDYYWCRLRGEESPKSYLFRIVRRDGSIRWVETRANLIDWEGGRATLVFLTDTTERKAAEQAIAEGAEKFRVLFENSPDAIILIDEDRFADCNAAACRMVGCEAKKDVVGRYAWDFSPEKQPGGRLSRDVAREAAEIALRRGSNRIEWMLCSPEGGETWLDVALTAVPIGGRQILHAVLRDITESKRAEASLRASEERYRKIYENSQDGIFQCDPRGHYIDVNPAYARMYGFESSREMMRNEGSAGTLYADPEDEQKFREQMGRDGEVRNFVSQRKRRDGSVFWASTNAHTVTSREGEIVSHEGMAQDITDLKKAQEALGESEEQFRNLADHAGLGIYLIQDDVFRYVNRRFADTYGRRVDEILDKMGAMDLVTPDRAAEVAKNVARRLSGDADFITYELTAPTPNRGVINVEIHGSRTVRQGRPAVIGTAQDITNRKRGEEALKRAEAKYRAMFEDALMGIFQTTPEGRVVEVNPAFCRMLGYSSPDDVAHSISDLATQLYVHPEDRMRFHTILSSGRLVEGFETEFYTKDRTVVSVRMNARAIRDPHDNATHYEGTAEDITARKRAEEALRKSEQRFRSLVETTSDWIWEVDENGVYTYASPKIRDILGYRPDEIVGKTAFDFMEPCEAERMKAVFRDFAESGKSFIALENTNIHKEGRKVVLESSGVPVFDNYGHLSGYRGIDRDITRRREAEKALLWKTTFLEALVESTLDGILILDEHKRKVAHNKRVVEMWNMPPDIAETEDPEQCIDFLMACIRNPEDFGGRVRQLRHDPNVTIHSEIDLKSGSVVEAFSYPVLHRESGERYGRIWMFRDITEMRRYWDMLENLSATDGLTGISNRRRFDEFLEREWRRSTREQPELSLLIIDIDYFKRFNDRYGHLAGDDVLRRVAEVLGEVVRRATDLVARYGGEEFVCVLPGTGETGAMEMARRIVNEIAALRIPHERSAVAEYVTVSVGAATEVPGRGLDCSDLIGKADRCLYSAKRQGRNRAVAIVEDHDGKTRGDGGWGTDFYRL
jgi:diguanylate cyclase (GGDEF)-like protein/PAS domain S-box-containing protein